MKYTLEIDDANELKLLIGLFSIGITVLRREHIYAIDAVTITSSIYDANTARKLNEKIRLLYDKVKDPSKPSVNRL